MAAKIEYLTDQKREEDTPNFVVGFPLSGKSGKVRQF